MTLVLEITLAVCITKKIKTGFNYKMFEDNKNVKRGDCGVFFIVKFIILLSFSPTESHLKSRFIPGNKFDYSKHKNDEKPQMYQTHFRYQVIHYKMKSDVRR